MKAVPSPTGFAGLRRRALAVAALAALGVTVAACSEKLDGGAACPTLCARSDVAVRDTTIDPFLPADPTSSDTGIRSSHGVDTTLVGFGGAGTSSYLLLSSRADTIDARSVFRFDTLPSRRVSGTDTIAVTEVDSAQLVIFVGDTLGSRGFPFTIEAYDVETGSVSPSDAAVFASFTSDRLLGSRTFASRDSLGDSTRIPIASAALLSRIRSHGRLRIGLRVRPSSGSAQLRLLSSDAGSAFAAHLRYRVAPDTAIAPVVAPLYSAAPTGDVLQKLALRDYTIASGEVVAAPPPDEIAVGGMLGARGVLRFQIPQRLLDSTSIIQASLLLTQLPNHVASDTVHLWPRVSEAGIELTSLVAQAQLLLPFSGCGGLGVCSGDSTAHAGLGVDSLLLVSSDSGARRLNVGAVLNYWRTTQVATSATTTKAAPRVLVLQSPFESAELAQLRFFSSRAANPAVRPRLRISYIDRSALSYP